MSAGLTSNLEHLLTREVRHDPAQAPVPLDDPRSGRRQWRCARLDRKTPQRPGEGIERLLSDRTPERVAVSDGGAADLRASRGDAELASRQPYGQCACHVA